MYGRALLKRGTAVFDELKQSMMDIASLSDVASGELRIGCSEAIADGQIGEIKLATTRPRMVVLTAATTRSRNSSSTSASSPNGWSDAEPSIRTE